MVRQTLKAKTNGVVSKAKSAIAAAKAEVKKTAGRKRKSAPVDDDEDAAACDSYDEKENKSEDEEDVKKPVAKKPRTKAAPKKADDTMPLAPRTAVTSLKRAMYIGAHVSGAGGVQNSITNALQIGANSFAVFLKSQRKWTSPPLAPESKTQFHALLKQHNYDAAKYVLPHGSYLVNLAQADEVKAKQAFDNFVDDLQRCEALGIKLYNFHPGSTGGDTMQAACARIASQLNRSHKETSTVITVIENMCGSGNVVGSRFEELRDIINGVEDKSRVGVCIDTCHAFAAGYDLRTPEAFAATMAEFDKVVGIKYLKAFHLNDSKAPFGSHRDLHANIGTGFLGLRAFHIIMNHEPFQNLPMVLETPIDEKGPNGKAIENKQIWADEIKLLESLIGRDAETPEFEAQAAELQAKGASERAKVQEQVDKKAEKESKKGSRGPKKAATKKKKVETGDEDESD
ncbi:xylose isomerase-like protein [Podospora aff. communis PSN243]|uniref:Apurinic-apyrimidinic endonuclease 1 n=1 Tax=Podospora aff. communis PSN243 TaxID=3040156 RepID=A0AAV9GGD3_9PEZI|nr:xylose isomerase-like protein [Podospora aff. communis PSN243]